MMKEKKFVIKIGIFLLIVLGLTTLVPPISSSIAVEFRVNQFTGFPPGKGAENPAVATDSNNHIIITWGDPRIGDDNVIARIFDGNGTPLSDDFRVDEAPDVASDSSIAIDKADNFIITWEESRTDDDIFARIFNSDGNPLTAEFRVDQAPGNTEATQPVIASYGNNKYIIAWTDYRSGNRDIFARIFENICECNLVPDDTVIPRGGTLGFTATVTNYTDDNQTVKFATKLRLPNGKMYPPGAFLFGPINIPLTPYGSRSAHLSQKIPNIAPLGIYTYYGYIGKVGQGVIHQCEFDFEVTASAEVGEEAWETFVDQEFIE